MREVELLVRKSTLMDMQLWIEQQLLEIERELGKVKK